MNPQLHGAVLSGVATCIDRNLDILRPEILRSFGLSVRFVELSMHAVALLKTDALDFYSVGSSATAEDISLITSETSKSSPRPLLIFLGQSDEKRTIQYLNSGFDAVLSWRVSEEILAAQICALRRRAQLRIPSLVIFDMQLDLFARTITRGERRAWLSPKEFDLLQYLFSNSGKTISRSEIARTVWGHHDAECADSCKQVIRTLRKKLSILERDSLLHTIWNEGYRFGT